MFLKGRRVNLKKGLRARKDGCPEDRMDARNESCVNRINVLIWL